MNIYIKSIIISIFISSFIHANAYDIRLIQGDFYNKVILEPLYNKYYKKSLEEFCKDKANDCYGIRLSNFMQKKYFKNIIKKRDERFKLDNKYIKQVEQLMHEKKEHLDYTQFVTFVDLSHQVLAVLLWDNSKKVLEPVGFDFISSGNIDREAEVKKGEDHFLKTPTGFFPIVSGWRSKGKVYEDNYTMPYGEKDRFVFFFGIQKSIRYNTFDKDGSKLKDEKEWKLITDKLSFAVHSHISKEPMGIPNSHGCIRMSNELNSFLDNNLVFFKDLYEDKKWIHPYKKPPTEPRNYALAGKYILIVDKIQ